MSVVTLSTCVWRCVYRADGKIMCKRQWRCAINIELHSQVSWRDGYPKNLNLLFIYLSSGHPRCRWIVFFSPKVKIIFSWNHALCWFINCESMAAIILRVKKAYTGSTKIIPMAAANRLRFYEANRSICARNWTLFLSWQLSEGLVW